MTTRDESVLSIERTNTVLYCERWLETVAFYRTVLGLRVAFENDWFVEFQLAGSSFLSIADASRATIGAVDGPPPPAPVTPSWSVLSTGLTNFVTPWPDHARHTEVILISAGLPAAARSDPETSRYGAMRAARLCPTNLQPRQHRAQLWMAELFPPPG